jgi:serine/threonine protein kinase
VWVCFQFLPVSDDPAKVLRTKTKGIGTDNYRAPEVNAGIHSYDPSAADIWSLGVTLFFLVSFLPIEGPSVKR